MTCFYVEARYPSFFASDCYVSGTVARGLGGCYL